MAKRGARPGICGILMAALLFSSARASGQEPRAQLAPPVDELSAIEEIRAEVPRLLASSDTRELAWATYLVGKHRLTEQVPALLDLLANPPEGGRDKRDLAYMNAINSLIELDAEIPPALLLSAYKRYSDEVLFYLSIAPERREETLLRLLEQTSSDEDWFVITSLLAEIRSPRVSAILLKGVEITLLLTVRDDGRTNICPVKGYATGGAQGNFIIPEGYPPITFFSASIGQDPDAPDWHKATFTRRVALPRGSAYFSNGGSNSSRGRDSYRLEWLARLLGTTGEGLGLDLYPVRVVAWQNAHLYLQDLEVIRSGVEESYGQLLKRFLDKDLISHADLASLKPGIKAEICDKRKDRAVKLPSVIDRVRR